MATEKFTNLASSTLNGAINNSVTSLDVTSAASFPTTGQFRIMIASEIMLVTAVSSNTFTVTRGIEGTSAASHSNGDTVVHILTKGGLDQLFADNYQIGTTANLPSAEREGRIYQATDYPLEFRDTGSTWQARWRNNMPVTSPNAGSYAWSHGGATATDSTVTNGPVLLEVGSASNADKISKFVKSVASAPYVYTHCFAFNLNDVSGAYGGPCWSDGTKVIGTGIITNTGGGGQCRFWVGKWTNLTTFSADYITRLYLGMNPGMLWIQIGDDNTNRYVKYSLDGVYFQTVHSVGRTDFLTATDVGIYIGNSTSGTTAKMTWISDS